MSLGTSMREQAMIPRKNQEEQIVESRRPATMAAQALGWIDESTKALIPPVHPSTTFIRDPDNQYRTGYWRARCRAAIFHPGVQLRRSRSKSLVVFSY
jgi:hypothetical protein